LLLRLMLKVQALALHPRPAGQTSSPRHLRRSVIASLRQLEAVCCAHCLYAPPPPALLSWTGHRRVIVTCPKPGHTSPNIHMHLRACQNAMQLVIQVPINSY
jgi:hypothetical protein